jgi:IS30 family transposase
MIFTRPRRLQMTSRFTGEQRREIRRLAKEGKTLAEVARQVGCGLKTAAYHAKREERPNVSEWAPEGRLGLCAREEIFVGLAHGETYTAIARRLGCAVSTVSREVAKNGGPRCYRASAAQVKAHRRARRPKRSKLEDPRLNKVVTGYLTQWYSPEQVSGYLRLEFPDDPMMRVSHETIYKCIYVQARGGLKVELAECLRSGRYERKPRSGVKPNRGPIADKVMISERPAEPADRSIPGVWEGDLIVGKDHASAVGTLVERTTGFVLLLHLAAGKTADDVNRAMKKKVAELPAALMRSITWDQGSEMARHVDFTAETGIQVYFCDPHSPWQRPSNENTNGLLRQYMPKGSDLSVHSEAQLDAFAASLNDRPRKRLGFVKPSVRFAELLALTR